MKNYLKLLGIVPILIFMIVTQSVKLGFATKMVILGAIICITITIGIYFKDDKTKKNRNTQYLMLFIGITISVAVFIFQFFNIQL